MYLTYVLSIDFDVSGLCCFESDEHIFISRQILRGYL